MITVFELKNKSFCRCFIRTPYYIKNLFLLAGLLMFLALVNLVYFSREGVYVMSIKKILRGLNSEIFNYISDHRSNLRMSPRVMSYPASSMNTHFFYNNCVRLNKPCKIDNLAKDSDAYRKWGFIPDRSSTSKTSVKDFFS